MRTRYKQWAVDYLENNPNIVIDKLDLKSDFFKRPISIEIGSGKGEFIYDLAKMNPDHHFLAVERNQTVAGMMAKKLNEDEIKNVLVCPLDIAKLFEQIPDEFFDDIYLNFSDPWPKKKHAKRRLTFITFLEQYYKLLKSGGHIYIKTDNDGLYEFTLEEIEKTKFHLELKEFDYQFDEAHDAMTGYERKFREMGQPIHRIILKK